MLCPNIKCKYKIKTKKVKRIRHMVCRITSGKDMTGKEQIKSIESVANG